MRYLVKTQLSKQKGKLEAIFIPIIRPMKVNRESGNGK